MKALWNGQVIAESDDTVVVESNHFFPMSSVNHEYLIDSAKSTVCSWKGTANYYNVAVDGNEVADAAFYYAQPKDAATSIKDRVAFWRGVEVTA